MKIVKCGGLNYQQWNVAAQVIILLGMMVLGTSTVHAAWQWSHPLPQGNTLNDMVWHEAMGKYFAVGDKGTLLVSADGISWQYQRVAAGENLNSIIWDGGQWVIGGNNAMLLTSPDGSNWRIHNAESTLLEMDIYSLAEGNGVIVAVGDQGKIAYSQDAISWSLPEDNPTQDLLKIIWGKEQFVAVGFNGVVATSENGTSWQTIQVGFGDLLDVIWTGTHYVVVSGDGEVYQSEDAMTWGEPIQVLGAADLRSIIWSGTEYTVVGGFGKIFFSTDLQEWSEQNSGTNERLRRIIQVNNQMTIIGRFGIILTQPLTQDDGSWNLVTAGSRAELMDIAVTDDQHAVVVGREGTVLRNENGGAWVEQDSGTNVDLYGVIRTQDKYTVVGSSGKIITSVTGTVWQDESWDVSRDLYDIASAGNNDVIVGAFGTILLKTAEGLALAASVPVTEHLKAVAWVGDKFVSVGNRGVVLTSEKGNTWSIQNLDTTNLLMSNTEDLLDIAWSGESMIVVGAAGSMIKSENGIDWIAVTAATTNAELAPMFGVTWGGAQFIAMGFNGKVMTSADGSIWEEELLDFDFHFNKGAMIDNDIVVVGLGGAILTNNEIVPPVADAGLDQSIISKSKITLAGNGFDDGHIVQYQWEQTDGVSVTLSANDQAIVTFTAPEVNADTTLTFKLTVTDNEQATASDTVIVTIKPKSITPSPTPTPENNDDSGGSGMLSLYFWLSLWGLYWVGYRGCHLPRENQ